METSRTTHQNSKSRYRYKVSIIVPAFNEEATILSTLKRIRAQEIDGVHFEVVVVDDGSTDGTISLLDANPDLYDVFVRQPSNGGKGAAVRAGLQNATGEYILFQDADDEYDPDDYFNLILPIMRFDADVVMGSRMIAPQYTRVSYFWHKVGNRFITFAFNILNNTTFTDIYTCYLVYRRNLLEPDELVSDGWEQQAEILTRIIARSKNAYEVPISYHGRTYSEGKKIRAHDIIDVISTIIYRRFFR